MERTIRVGFFVVSIFRCVNVRVSSWSSCESKTIDQKMSNEKVDTLFTQRNETIQRQESTTSRSFSNDSEFFSALLWSSVVLFRFLCVFGGFVGFFFGGFWVSKKKKFVITFHGLASFRSILALVLVRLSKPICQKTIKATKCYLQHANWRVVIFYYLFFQFQLVCVWCNCIAVVSESFLCSIFEPNGNRFTRVNYFKYIMSF